MREGVNPGKLEYQLEPFKEHRIVMPVHIPNEEGFFRHAAEILRLSLESLFVSMGEHSSVTVISNGSGPHVVRMLRSYFDAGLIDQLVLNDSNWGKVDAALAASHARFERLITVSDADVLFRPGWFEAVGHLFRTFPECGVATPAPNPSLAFLHTTATILSALAGGELRFERIVAEHDLDRFAKSIGRPDWFKPEHRRAQMAVRRDGTVACVGGGHFVFTIRRELMDRVPHEATLAAMGAGLTERFDDPPDAMGAWRLSTTRAYAYHMGNLPEPWMYEEFARGQAVARGQSSRSEIDVPPLKPSRLRCVPLPWRKRIVAAVRKAYLEPRWVNASPRATEPRSLPPEVLTP